MKKHLLLASLCVLPLALASCCSDDECNTDPARAASAGTVNMRCPVMPDDLVDPDVAPVMWKGQKVGFCCKGCKPKWEAMNDSQRDAAVANAIAASK